MPTNDNASLSPESLGVFLPLCDITDHNVILHYYCHISGVMFYVFFFIFQIFTAENATRSSKTNTRSWPTAGSCVFKEKPTPAAVRWESTSTWRRRGSVE